MQRLWLIFAQTVTVAVAVLFVLTTLKPEWLPQRPAAVTIREAAGQAGTPGGSASSFHEAARKALPAVVHIYTTQAIRTPRNPLFNDPIFRHFFGNRDDNAPQRSAGLGSGVIINPDGYILTNFHVIEGAEAIEVALNDGRTLKAEVVGSDWESDLAVLQIKASKLPAITFGQMESLHVGDVVLAIGNPFGVGQTVTMGIVSALGRSNLGINAFENFIQTDAAINPGNSGGALIDAAGNLIGINSAIYSRSGGSNGIGFAIPVSSAKSIMEQIIQNGRVIRGWIGIEAQRITPEQADSIGLPNSEGTLITEIARNSPADRAGIHTGDVLLAVNGKAVKDLQVMLDLITNLRPGDTVPFRIRRERSTLELPIQIGRRPAMQRPEKD